MTTDISRRGFARILGASVAYTTLVQTVTHATPVIRLVSKASPDVETVRLSSNENPYGPSPAALRAMTDSFGLAWRYPDGHAENLNENLAKLHSVSSEQILLGNGSGELLKLAAAAFTNSSKPLVVAEPTFEAIARHARTAGAEVLRVNLDANYAHNLDGMLTAATETGLIYICNPNNPTASLTSKDAMRAFLAKVSERTIVLVDEAYHHYVDSADYESVIPLVKQYPNLIVARTFSKIYGMAGLRCGYCVTSSTLIQRMRAHQTWDSVNIMALVAAQASIRDREQVEQGRRRNDEVRKYVYSQLDKSGMKYVPSHANFLMIDVRRDVRSIISTLRGRQVEVGRQFPALPNFLRVTIGTRPQMETFVAALKRVAA